MKQLSLIIVTLVTALVRVHAQDSSIEQKKIVPYVPTPPEVVAAMLKLGGVGKDDFVIDLGCGDGRIVVAAAKQFGAHALGIDIDPERIKEARENAQKEGVTDLVEFRQADLFDTDLRKATVVTLYLLPSVNMKLRPKLWRELKPGSRVVSHSFDMEDWKPEKEEDIDGTQIFLWTIGKQMPSRK